MSIHPSVSRFAGYVFALCALLSGALATVAHATTTLTLSGTPAVFVEGGSSVSVDSGILVVDDTYPTLTYASLTINSNLQTGIDLLSFTNDGVTMGDIAVSSYSDNGTTAQLTLTSAGASTVAQWQAALRAVKFNNSSANPTTVDRTIRIFTLDQVSNFSNIVDQTVEVRSLQLSGASINQSAGVNGTVGTLSTTTTDTTSFTYTLVSGTGSTDNGSFNISGTTLRANNAAALAAGTYSVRVQTDTGLGAPFPFSKSFTITVVDNVPPTVSSINRVGSTPTNATTVDFTVTFSENVTGVDATDFTLTTTGTASGSISSVAAVNASTYTVTVNSLSGDGTLRLDLNSSGTGIADVATNPISGGFTSGQTYTLDHTAPAAPVISGITSDTGASGTDGVTSDQTLVLTGTAEASSTVTVTRVGTGVIGTTTADGSGNWSFDYTGTTLPDGTYSFTATATDAAGNTGASSSAFGVTVDTAAPVITSAATATATYKSAFSYNITASGSPVSYGATGLPGGLSVNSSTGAISGSATQTGGFSVTLSATDLAGNVGTASLSLTVNAATLTVSGITAADKVYDAGLSATLNTSGAALVGVASGDTVTLGTSGATGAFLTKTVAGGKTVNITGLTIGGTNAGSYTLTQPSTTAAITAKSLTVTGITAANKVYDGTTTATINVSGATLVGVVPGDTVTLVTSGASGSFATATAGVNKTVTISGLTISGPDAGNYSLVQPTTTATITGSSAVTVTLGSLSQTYDGSPKPVTVTTTPSVSVSVTYNGSATVPVNAGTYAVVATVTDPSYTGSATGTLVVNKANQTMFFATITGAVTGSPIPMYASASSGLGLSFSVVSGDATVSGSTLTVNSGSSVTIRATQAGNANYNSISVDQTIKNIAQLSQTITFDPLPNKLSTDAAFTLKATASSGLPVTFTVMSGPALILGNTVTLSGAPGLVTIRASQAGNSLYGPAADVTRTFTVTAVGPLVYFGTLGTNPFAANLTPDGKSGTMLGVIPGTGEAFVITFTPGSDGTWTSTITALGIVTAASAGEGSLGTTDTLTGAQVRTQAMTPTGSAGIRSAAALSTRTFRGVVSGGTISGSIDGLGLTFTGQLASQGGATASVAGYYPAKLVQTSSGSIYAIFGAQGQAYVLVVTPTYIAGNLGTVTSAGVFQTDLGGQVKVAGTVDTSATTVTGSFTLADGTSQSFAGLAATTTRTDRLLNLSSRARVRNGATQLITGFVVGGTVAKPVLLRAVGPSLAQVGISAPLSAASLRLYDSQSRVIKEVSGWSYDPTLSATFARVGAFGFNSGDFDSAYTTTLAPGSYSVEVVPAPDASGKISAAGIGLAEIYDASLNPQSEYQRLVNISTRGYIESGDGVLIGGFVIAGNSPKRLLIRGVGPALTPFNVPDALQDPVLTLYSGQTVIARNDNWGTPVAVTSTQVAATADQIVSAASQVSAFPYATGSRDAAIIVTLQPGIYTAIVSSANSTTGTGLIEIYEVTNE